MLEPNQRLIESQIAPAEQKRNIWLATIPYGTKRKDIFAPDYFANVAHMLNVGDRIECRDEAGEFEIHLSVIALGEKTQLKNSNWANVIELHTYELLREEDKKLKLPEGFQAKYKGGLKWCVVRLGAHPGEDQTIIDKQPTKGDAIREFEKMKSRMVA